MAWHPLDGAREQVGRARSEIEKLTAEVTQFFDEHPETRSIETGMDGSYQTAALSDLPVFPSKWGNDVKDIAGNLRSPLDYLVHELALNAGSDPDQKTAFPIAVKRDEYWRLDRKGVSYRDRCLVGVSDAWKLKIDDLQPYHSTKTPDDLPLARLNELTNRTKHREAAAPHALIDLPGHFVVFPSRHDVKAVTFKYRGGVVEGQFQFRMQRPRPGSIIEMHPKPQATNTPPNLGITFGERLMGIGDLIDIADHVDRILGWFDPAFEPAPDSGIVTPPARPV